MCELFPETLLDLSVLSLLEQEEHQCANLSDISTRTQTGLRQREEPSRLSSKRCRRDTVGDVIQVEPRMEKGTRRLACTLYLVLSSSLFFQLSINGVHPIHGA